MSMAEEEIPTGRSPRVLIACTSSRHEVGGMEAIVRSVARALRAQGWPVTVAYTEDRFEEIDEQTWAIRLKPPRTRWKLPTPASIAEMCVSVVGLIRLLKRVRPDVVNMHFVTVQSLYWFILRPVFGYRVVLSAHGSDVFRPANRMDRALLPWLLRTADAITVVSPVLAERVRDLTGGRGPEPVVIPNGVDLAFWTPGGTEPSGERPVVVTVGRLHRVKGHDVLLEALVEVCSRIPGVRLHLVGDGPEREATEALVRELGLDDVVELLGVQPSEVIRDELRNARAFVLSSRSEGMPLSLLEAMSVGCPVVATSVGGVPSLLDGAGVEVAPEDPQALAAALIHLLQHADVRADYSERAQKRAASYAWLSAADAYRVTLDQAAR